MGTFVLLWLNQRLNLRPVLSHILSPLLSELWQEDHKFGASLGYIMKPYPQNKIKQKEYLTKYNASKYMPVYVNCNSVKI